MKPNPKKLPLSFKRLEEITSVYPTPFHLYDEKGIRENMKKVRKIFSWMPGFKNYYAVKACPNPYILKILRGLLSCLTQADLLCGL